MKEVRDEDLSPLKFCRSCYGHLAGRIGVRMTEQMIKNRLLKYPESEAAPDFTITPKGRHFFENLEIDVNALEHKSGLFAKACLDFSERRYHLGGAVGRALLTKMIEDGWMKRIGTSRLVVPTEKGMHILKEKYRLSLY